MRRWSLVAAAVVPVLLGLVGNMASAALPSGWQRWQWLAWPVFVVLGLLAVAQEIGRRRAPEPGGDRLTEAARALEIAARAQWTREAEVRELVSPRLLPLPWSTTDRPVLPPMVDIVGPEPRRLDGGVPELIDAFLDLPARRLIVLGEPGAGKSVLAILLTLALLDKRDRDRVPVLVSVSSWRVGEEPLLDYLTRRLREDYPALANTARYGPDAAGRLVREKKILPVFDGMDELPPALHARAIELIDAETPGQHLVLTCRSAEYQAAVARAESIPATALVVELRPVDRADTVAYLAAGHVADDPRWAPLFADLRANPDSPLAEALRTPLMISLVRVAYRDRDSEPGELVDRFTTRAEVEGHLLDAFLTASYGPDSRAERWLRFLARHLHRQRTYEFAWWRLHRALPARQATAVIGLGAGLVAAVVATVAVWLAVAPTIATTPETILLGLAGGGVASLIVTAEVGSAARRTTVPRRVRLRGRSRGLGVRLVRSTARRVAIGVAAGIVAEISYTLAFDIDDPTRLGLVIGSASGLISAVAFGLADWLGIPADAVTATDPGAVLRTDRAANAVQLLVFASAFGLPAGLALGLVASPLIGLLDGIGFALGGVAVALARRRQAWSRFTVVRLWLALRGRLPRRLMPFLADAHRRGVLRESGGVYQFRHALLQDRLAGATEPITPIVEGEPDRAPRRMQRYAALGGVALVLGVSLGVGLPVAGALQTRCGVSPFDRDIRFVRTECVGVTDGSFALSPGLASVTEMVARENAAVRGSRRPYVRVALLTPMDDPSSVRGAFVAQMRANRSGGPGPLVELVLANPGHDSAYWSLPVERLVEMSRADHPVVAAVGLGPSTVGSVDAVRYLSAAGIPTVAAYLSADQAPVTLSTWPSDDQLAFKVTCRGRECSLVCSTKDCLRRSDVPAWLAGVPGTPAGFPPFTGEYRWFGWGDPNEAAVLDHDAAYTAFTAITRTVGAENPPAVRTALGRLTRDRPVYAATGNLSWNDGKASPSGRVIVVVESPTSAYMYLTR
ncbi:NACHT domain-containing protein [Actinokineospora enzanensis]|uniref:NACHT domain-containing protein n=1 Tax=Actinokineospora enzanensis TaxID=155975 RepID=UPI000373AE22|nr:NACHT domain-containing protein [Actinokineospora enzanensis]